MKRTSLVMLVILTGCPEGDTCESDAQTETRLATLESEDTILHLRIDNVELMPGDSCTVGQDDGSATIGCEDGTSATVFDGDSCSVQQNVGSATISCEDGSEATVIDGGAIDESNLMHLSGSETVAGMKTFTSPVAFAGSGRFTKRIPLSPTTGLVSGTAAADYFSVANVPAIRIGQGGEVTFNLTVPDDIDLTSAMRIRLLWGIESASTSLNVTWRVRAGFAQANTTFSSLASTTLAASVAADPNTVYATNSVSLPATVAAGDLFGVVGVGLESVSPSIQVFLTHVEITYLADRLGTPLP